MLNIKLKKGNEPLSEARLKNYTKYSQKLENFASLMNIRVVYQALDTEGVYVPSRNKIIIADDLPEAAEIAVLLHELGHAMDQTFHGADKEANGIEKAYEAIYAGRFNARHQDIVISCEKRAWKYGKSIAKTLKIPLGKWYSVTKKACLDTYK